MAALSPRVGTQLGSYKLLELLGHGGMGVVYLAEHVYIGKKVAVKILHDRYVGRDEAVQRFLREARAATQINHPNIVDVTDFGELPDGTVYFVMEYITGEPLDVVLSREKRLPLLRTITILNQMTRALGAAHAMGIIHRDLKPENIMLTSKKGRRELVRHVIDDSGEHDVIEKEDRFDFVKILDFGVAKIIEPDGKKVTQQGVVMGTPEYMAPETARSGKADARSDVYALGVMLYEMLTGEVPFEGDTPMEIMLKQVSDPPPPPRKIARPGAEITDAAERLIMRTLSKDPNERPQSMSELHDELQNCYGAVRYRRIETGTATPAPRTRTRVPPILLTKIKGHARIPGEPPTPPPAPERIEPIKLTKKKA